MSAPLIIDAIALIYILISIKSGYSRGFIVGILGLVGFFAGLYLAGFTTRSNHLGSDRKFSGCSGLCGGRTNSTCEICFHAQRERSYFTNTDAHAQLTRHSHG